MGAPHATNPGGDNSARIDQLAYLKSTNDTTDRTAEAQQMLNRYGYVRLSPGPFWLSPITLSSGQSIFGSGLSTILNLNSAATAPLFTCASKNTFRDFIMSGGLTAAPTSSTLGNRHGIRMPAATPDVVIDNVMALGFSGAGFYGVGTGYNELRSFRISNCFAQYNAAGLFLDASSEYGIFYNVSCINNYYGCANYGGNNLFSGCHFVSNAEGFYLYGDTTAAPNSGHGSCVACTFNHNTAYGIHAESEFNGFSFNGCQIHLNITDDIYLHIAKGFIFSGNQFGNGAKINITVGNQTTFANNIFNDAPTISEVSESHLVFVNNYTIDGVAVNYP